MSENQDPAVVPLTYDEAKALGSSVVRDLRERFQLGDDGLPLDSPEVVDRHLSSIGGASAFTTAGPGQQKVPMHPEVADAIREDDGWGDALVSILRYAGNPEESISTVSERRRRLRRLLNALNHAMGVHPDLAELEVRDDLAHLGLALEGLDVGVIRPILRKPEGVGNRPPDTRSMQQFRVYVVAFALLLDQSGVKRSDAFTWVADQLTAAGAKGSRRDATEKPGFKPDTVKRYFYDAMPGSDEAREEARSQPNARVSKKRDGDTGLVTQLLSQFVLKAEHDGEAFPTTEAYAKNVIRRTMADPAFQDLIP